VFHLRAGVLAAPARDDLTNVLPVGRRGRPARQVQTLVRWRLGHYALQAEERLRALERHL